MRNRLDPRPLVNPDDVKTVARELHAVAYEYGEMMTAWHTLPDDQQNGFVERAARLLARLRGEVVDT